MNGFCPQQLQQRIRERANRRDVLDSRRPGARRGGDILDGVRMHDRGDVMLARNPNRVCQQMLGEMRWRTADGSVDHLDCVRLKFDEV